MYSIKGQQLLLKSTFALLVILEIDQAATLTTFHYLFSPSGVSDGLLQRPDGARRPALLSAQYQSLLWGCLWLLWLHVLQPWTGAQLRRVSVSSNSKCVLSLNTALQQRWVMLTKNHDNLDMVP